MKLLFSLLLVIIFSLFLAGCDVSTDTFEKEQQMTESNQGNLLKTQPPERLQWSLERENINRRTRLWNDPNKVSYIYLISFGKVMAFYVIKGKVSSVNSMITNPEQIYSDASGGNLVLSSPAEDGSYGTNGDAVYFFTTDGAYVEWNDAYMQCDKPLKLSTPPEIVRVID